MLFPKTWTFHNFCNLFFYYW